MDLQLMKDDDKLNTLKILCQWICTIFHLMACELDTVLLKMHFYPMSRRKKT